MENIILRNGDCLEIMKEIDDKSIDLVLIDPPYNIGKSKEWDKWETKEKYVEFMGEVFKECERVLKSNGSMYWFHNDMVQISMLMEWLRNNSNFNFNSFITLDKDWIYCKSWKNPTSKNTLRSWFNTSEYCLLYVKGDCLHTEWDKTGWDKVRLDINNFSNLRKYAYDMLCFIGGANLAQLNTSKDALDIEKLNTFFIVGKRSVFGEIGGKADHFMRYGSSQWSLPTEETYNEIIEKFKIREWSGFREYESLRQEYESLRQEYESLRQEYESLRQEYESLRYTHNLDPNHNNVFTFKRDKGKNYHPCQKPLDILERLIKTSSNQNDIVLDCFMGSGSTGIACINTNRKFYGIEKDEHYFDVAKNRIEEHLKSKE